MNTPILSAINVPLSTGDFVVYVNSANGFIDVSKGIVVNLLEHNKVSILAIYGESYLYGQPKPVYKVSDVVRRVAVYGRNLVQISDTYRDPDFKRLMDSDKYKKLMGS